MPQRWQESLCALFLVTLFCIPISAIAQSRAGWFGLLAYCTTEIALFLCWLQLETPRPEFGNVVGSFLDAAVFVAVSYLWGKLVFNRQNDDAHG